MNYQIPHKKHPLKQTSQPTKKPKYLKWLHEVKQPACLVCNISIGIQIHHVKESSSDRKDDTCVIPLCYHHHLGTELSPHGTPKLFKEVMPMDIQRQSASDLYKEYENEHRTN